jgi:hypothetical protein
MTIHQQEETSRYRIELLSILYSLILELCMIWKSSITLAFPAAALPVSGIMSELLDVTTLSKMCQWKEKNVETCHKNFTP